MNKLEKPKFSIIIPARNEEANLGRCLDAIEKATRVAGSSVEVIVVLNRCTDSTPQIAMDRGCRSVESAAKNLSIIRNSGAKVAQGEILITVDADSFVSENMLKLVEETLASGKYIGGGVALYPERYSLGILLTALCLIPIVLWYGISGGLFYCLKRDFDAIGGFNEDLCSVEDIDFAKRLKKWGKLQGKSYTTLFRAWITTSCRKFDRLGDWYFITHPHLFLSLLKGRNQSAADKIWYDFER